MTNKLFGTDGVRGVANVYPMDVVFASKLADVLSELQCKDKKRVAIGRDTRISGEMLEAALCAEFMANGIDVILLGIVPTPLVTLKTASLDVDLSVMITASHNPYSDNGLKLIDANGNKFDDKFYEEVEKRIENHIRSEKNPEKIGKIIKNE